MKLLIVSDSHGESNVLEKLKLRYEKEVDVMIHCGDSELPVDDEALKGFITVRGNCDIDLRLPTEQEITVGKAKILITHGHLYQINSTLLKLSYKAKERRADFVFFGHSHLPGSETIDGTIFLNPGSILLPRGGNERSYAIVEQDEKAVNVSFYNKDHKQIETLNRTYEK